MRNYAGFWEGSSKSQKERGVMGDYLDARERIGLPRYADVRVPPADPPDFIAREAGGRCIAVEVTELVSQETVEHNVRCAPIDRVVWLPALDEVAAVVADIIQKKDGKALKGGPYDEVHLLIHVDEPGFVPSSLLSDLKARAFGPTRQITRVFVLCSYEPTSQGCPYVELGIVGDSP